MMERDEIIRLAKLAFGVEFISESDGGKLERFAHLVAAEYKQDALRYRWLREQNATLEDRTFYVGIDDRAEPEGIMWVGSDLDSAIDAAMEKVK